MSAYNTDFTH